MEFLGMWLKGIGIGMLAGLCVAQPLDSPLTIQSDSATFDVASKTAIHRGSVVLSQENRTLFADELKIFQSKGKLAFIEAFGSPARYEGILKNPSIRVLGQANHIHYNASEDLLILEGNARLVHGQDTFEGPHIEYNIFKQSIRSLPNEAQQTIITLQPR